VIKAKKTRLVSLLSSNKRVVTFYETFSILFPYDFLQEVSCIISLCGKTKNGNETDQIFYIKQVFRTEAKSINFAKLSNNYKNRGSFGKFSLRGN
jgi:hypothetical protein